MMEFGDIFSKQSGSVQVFRFLIPGLACAEGLGDELVLIGISVGYRGPAPHPSLFDRALRREIAARLPRLYFVHYPT